MDMCAGKEKAGQSKEKMDRHDQRDCKQMHLNFYDAIGTTQ